MLAPNYQSTVWQVAAALKKRYRDFNHYNRKDLLDELFAKPSRVKPVAATCFVYKEISPDHLHIAEEPAEYNPRPMVSGGCQTRKRRRSVNIVTGQHHSFV